MRFVLAMLVSGCGFQGPFTGLAPTGDARGVEIDAPGVVTAIDAAEPEIDAAAHLDAGVIAIDAAPMHDAFVMADANPWPCGPEPAAPAASVTFGNPTTGMTASAISLDNAQRLVVSPNQALSLSFKYALHDSACDACVDQIEYGFVKGTAGRRIDCAFDRTLQNQAASGTVPTQVFNAPATAGQYDLRLAQAENFSCNYEGANDWYAGNPPPANQTLAIICVH